MDRDIAGRPSLRQLPKKPIYLFLLIYCRGSPAFAFAHLLLPWVACARSGWLACSSLISCTVHLLLPWIACSCSCWFACSRYVWMTCSCRHSPACAVARLPSLLLACFRRGYPCSRRWHSMHVHVCRYMCRGIRCICMHLTHLPPPPRVAAAVRTDARMAIWACL